MSDLQTPASAAGAATSDAPVSATAASNASSAQATGGRTFLPRNTLLRHLLVLVLCAVGAVVLLESTDLGFNAQIGYVAYYAIAAGGLTVLTGLNGQISLGHGALMAVGGYTTALMLDAEEPLPLVVIFLAAVALTSLVGAVVGVAAARLHGPYLAGATLALAVGLPGLALYFKETLGGEQGLTVSSPDRPEWFTEAIRTLSGGSPSGVKWIAYISVACLLITYFLLANLMRSRVGRTWRAVRDQEVAAELAGISLGTWRVVAFVVSAAAAGLAGAVLALVVRLTAPTAFTIVLSLSLLTAIVIGGLGSLFGALVGSVLLVFLPRLLRDAGESLDMDAAQAAEISYVVYGVILVVVMLFAPAGLVGSIRLALLRSRARRSARG
ncbi:branched-chain amino acid transport system permease protein [Geodermatophilus telluris]|uniref:Branched-chain amino acid transport system permease protein n=1 Tax=Geodermatophilus telluris TaxID=1190417 RepID=A0A1G6L9N5_9ACTN|nr:branched-chain amino acid ABC transporter permease [Geodermatophilus telluris]SDC40092.1 branched-chain amino acid transport system permease protein [Geodermatophilus telluris]